MTNAVAGPNLDKEIIVESGSYTVREMRLTWHKLGLLWEKISSYRTLFSDLTRGNFNNFLRFITEGDSVWLEVREGDILIGIVCLEKMQQVVDCEAHLIFFDRDLAGKDELCKKITLWVFANFPLNRVTVTVPRMYFATRRLVKAIGFTEEGCKRAAVLIRNRWDDVYIFGITREEARTKCRS